MPQVKIGAAHVDITPPIGTRMAGYIRRRATSHGIQSALWAKALYLLEGGREILVICIDSLAVDGTLLRLVRTAVEKATDIPAQNICLVATHTHSGPAGLAVLSFGGGHDDDLLALTVPKIVASVQQAKAGAFEARMKIGATVVEGIAQNRRDPNRPVDNTLHVLRIEDDQGQLRAVWVNYACHATCLGYDNLNLSADWPGAVRAVVEKVVGGNVIVMMTNGASGDIHPLFLDQTAADLERVGQIIGGAVVAMLGQLSATGHQLRSHNLLWGIEVQSPPPCGRTVEHPAPQLLQRRLSLPFREYCTQTEYDEKIAILCDQLVELGLERSVLQVMVKNPGTTYPYAITLDQKHYDLLGQLNALAGERLERERVLALSYTRPYQEIDLYRLSMDPKLSILFVPAELSNQIAQSIKAQCGLHELMVVTYANDYVGYLVPADDYASGGYDAGVSHFTPEAEAIFVEAALELVREPVA